MNHSDTTFDLRLVWQNIVQRPALWVAPTIVLSVAALGYSLLRSPSWEAKQALVVRDEAVGRVFTSQGKFASVDDMQTAQETVLEMAKSYSVLETALSQFGPRPTPVAVEELRGKISVKAPNGAEFGRTEVFYLIVEDSSRARSLKLTAAICDALEQQLADLRDSKAQSLIDELEKSVALTRSALDEATGRLAALEAKVGGDLAELRILNESAGGESSLRRTITNIGNDLRAEKQSQLENQQLLRLLVDSEGDPDGIVAMPGRLLQSQPALQRLKEGLVDAQLRTSQALGLMSVAHPKVQAAMEEEKDVRRRLHGELATAIRGVKVELTMNENRIADLTNQLADVEQRLGRIAGLRAEYTNLVADVHQHTETWNKAQHDLADARASQAAAHSASLITRLDGPQAGAYPVGPSRSVICLAGLAGGLFVGLSLVVLLAKPVATTVTNGSLLPGIQLTLKNALARFAFRVSAAVNRRPL